MRRMTILAVASLLLPLGACATAAGGSPPPGGPAGDSSPPAGSAGGPAQPAAGGTAQVMSVMREIAQCVRSHGAPDFPDPIMDPKSDYPAFPEDSPRIPDSARTACEPIARRLPPEAQRTHPPTPEYMGKLIRFAQCMREKGLPDWPDPGPDGDFSLSPRLMSGGKRVFVTQMRACDVYNPDPGKRIFTRRAT